MDASSDWYIIVNPIAGNGAVKKKIAAFEKQLKINQIPYEIVYTKYQKHAIELAIAGIGRHYRKIMAVGGDGTANEVVNGILQQQHVSPAAITFALLPVGTGNDWIRTHRIPKRLGPWIKMLRAGNTTFQDVGRATCFFDQKPVERFFINVAGMAYDAFVVEQIGKSHKRVSNKFLYLGWILKCLFKFTPPRAKVSFDGQVLEDYFYTINAGICRYSGGGMQFVPHAVADDGLLAVTVVREVSKMAVIINTPRFFDGSIIHHPRAATFQTKKISVAGEESVPILLEVDGEYIGLSPIEISVVEKSLRLIIP